MGFEQEEIEYEDAEKVKEKSEKHKILSELQGIRYSDRKRAEPKKPFSERFREKASAAFTRAKPYLKQGAREGRKVITQIGHDIKQRPRFKRPKKAMKARRQKQERSNDPFGMIEIRRYW